MHFKLLLQIERMHACTRTGLRKPAQQTVIPASSVPALLAPLPLSRLRTLGGKLGEEIASCLGISTVGGSEPTTCSHMPSASHLPFYPL